MTSIMLLHREAQGSKERYHSQGVIILGLELWDSSRIIL